jgi:hypothetical protein
MNRIVVSLVLCAAFLVSSDSFATTLTIANAGFETVVPIVDIPITAYGVWTGNPGEMVLAENGITPLEGERMLKFTGTKDVTNIWQLLATSLPAGTHITLSAAFNRLNNSNPTVGMKISAIPNGPPVGTELGTDMIASILKDVPTNTWTTVSLSAVVPANTVALGIELDYTGLGGYADNVQLQTVPEASTIVLAALGIIAVFAYRRCR